MGAMDIGFFAFLYLAVPGLSCSMRDLVPRPGIEPGPPALGAWSLSPWTTREVPGLSIFDSSNCHHPSFYDTFCHVLEHLLFEINSLWLFFLYTFLYCNMVS